MTFISIYFAVFLAAVLVLYYVLPHRFRMGFIALASLGFYCWWDIRYALLLLGTTTLIYVTVLAIARSTEDQKQFRLGIGATVLLVLLLGFFKYFDFFSLVLHQSLTFLSISQSPKPFALNLLIPIGISYYTFKAISYVMDSYWEKIEPEKNYLHLLAHLAFFPQIVSGPVQRAADFLPQASNVKEGLKFDPDLFFSGLKLILWGLFKKMVIADNVGLFVNAVHENPDNFLGFYSLMACWLYVFQLYTDFSGLSDIAIGMGRLLGIRTPQNFNSPFVAYNIQEFWRRWHITLTSWLSDYVFIPLRMQFRNIGNIGIAISIFINVAAIGFWHGAAWTFVLFGLIHAALVTLSYFTLDRRNKMYTALKIPGWLRTTIGAVWTFHLAALSMNLFRASSPGKAWHITKNIFHESMLIPTAKAFQVPFQLKAAIVLLVLFFLLETFSSIAKDPFDDNKNYELQPPVWHRTMRQFALYGFLGAMILAAGILDGATFIYEQF